jgi:hypothetical protein
MATDAATGDEEGGTPAADSGLAEPEAGLVILDSGNPPADGGMLFPPDAGVPAVDAGTGGLDGGNTDAGSPPDAGPADAGPPPDAGPQSWQFFDFSSTDFQAGTHQDTEVDPASATVSLKSAKLSGSFTSRQFDLGTTGSMETLAWIPAAPYGKPIPDDPGSTLETVAYTEDGLDLTGMVFLLHAEGQGDVVQNDAIIDSAAGHVVELEVAGAGGTNYVDGRLGRGLYVTKNDYFRIKDSDTHVDFAYTGEVFTWAGWVKFTSCDAALSDDNLILLGGEDPHIWIGARCPEETAHFQIMDDASNGVGTSTAIDIVDGQWHHLAGVKEKTPERGILYVDGEQAEIIPFNWGTFSNFTKEIFIGEFPIGTGPDYNYSSTLTFDEVVMFKRPLGPSEVRALYRRGITRMQLQVRVCMALNCGGTTFVGPDGTDLTYFSEKIVPPIVPTQNTGHLFPAPVAGRYVDYRVFFDTEDPAISPVLESVMIQGEIP